MASALAQIYKNVIRCKLCGSLKSNSYDCQNYVNGKEKYNKICVVEDIADQWSIQSSNIFHGSFIYWVEQYLLLVKERGFVNKFFDK